MVRRRIWILSAVMLVVLGCAPKTPYRTGTLASEVVAAEATVGLTSCT